ncbi:hypothetical protein BDN72DRAFT_640361 [Pluteus cervinus]|uniref:Uncharacterized protein n=1 Tax=Pluteus cervinus TaxID=181527 RepID=A0ACD3ATG5_9AGAR|nr:hypothetical protein BDN72DRAFT_640361 [Pluteus cervinus]
MRVQVPQFLAKFKKDPLPTFASFILFSVDPVETVQFLEDPEAVNAANKVGHKRYLAYVHKNCSWDRTQPDLVYDLILISRDTPVQDEEGGIEPYMCTPIAPTTYHPTGRKPVQPSKPLPIDNCYFHSKTVVKTVKAKNVWRRFDGAIILRGPDRYREYLTAGDDQNRSELLRRKFREQRECVPSPAMAADVTLEGAPKTQTQTTMQKTTWNCQLFCLCF